MGMIRFNYRSEAYGGFVDVSIVYPTDNLSYLPAREPQSGIFARKTEPYRPGMRFQTVYLLHGGGDDDTLVYRYTNAERYAQDNRVMLVTPCVVNSFGVDTNYGVRYSTFITEELPLVMQSLFASAPGRENNFIAGYAMGGNAALGNALMRPDLYTACVDMSGGIGLTVNTETLRNELENKVVRMPLYESTFGPAGSLDGSRHDMYAAAKRALASGEALPSFHLVAGSEEGFIRDRVYADFVTMRELGLEVDYTELEGYGHNFELWDLYLKRVLSDILPLKKAPIYL